MHLHVFTGSYVFCVRLVHCSRDLQILFSTKTTLKLGLIVLFTHLKIILLQYFQFSVFSSQQSTVSKQIPNFQKYPYFLIIFLNNIVSTPLNNLYTNHWAIYFSLSSHNHHPHFCCFPFLILTITTWRHNIYLCIFIL